MDQRDLNALKSVGSIMAQVHETADRRAPKGMIGLKISLPKKQFAKLEEKAANLGMPPEKLAANWLAERIDHVK